MTANTPVLFRRGQTNALLWPRPALVMGIVNINDDSFSGDGTLNVDQALKRALRMVRQGADIIDVGAESARTNRCAISVQEEIARLRPFIERFEEVCQTESDLSLDRAHPPLLSLNTWRPEVVAEVLPLGGDLLNDIGGLPDEQNARLCADHAVSLLMMHSVGEPKIAHTSEGYDDIWSTLHAFFEEKIRLAKSAGLQVGQLVLDPGIDFAKQRPDNLRIYAGLEQLVKLGHPVLLPISRKTVIGDVLGLPKPVDRDAGTLACMAGGLRRGAHIFRVHDVQGTVQALRILEKLL